MAEKKPAEKKAADKAAPKKAKKISVKYDVSGETLKRKKRSCPKCGEGTFMAEHKDRHTCGRCGYMEKR